MIYYDIHTHQPPVHSDDKVIVAADFRMPLDPEIAYAVGIHPWQAASNNALPILYELAQQPNVFAIGETGLDKRCATPFDRQEELFRVHIQLAEAMNKPLIIHCVKAWEQLLHMHKTSGRRIAWIIHGFTGNKTLAGQLLRAGFYLSFGLRFNPAAVGEAWNAHKLFAETDESPVDIRDVYARLAASIAITQDELGQQIAINFRETIQRP